MVGLGGSATNDGGAGLLAALGAAPLDAAGYALPYGGAALRRLRRRSAARPGCAASSWSPPPTWTTRCSGCSAPATSSARRRAPTRQDVLLLDAALARFAGVLERDLPGCPPGLAALPGAGAAGGLGSALLRARRPAASPGIGLVADADRPGRRGLDAADLVVTGEGAFDFQSLRGKVVPAWPGAARDRGVPCVVAGRAGGAGPAGGGRGRRTSAYSLVEHFGGGRTRGAGRARPTACAALGCPAWRGRGHAGAA